LKRNAEESMFRISRDGREPIIDVDSIEQIEPVVRAGKTGRYHVDAIAADTFPCRHTSRRWGFVTKRADGVVAIEPDPWDE
jgi:hypothetical protein